MRAGTSHAILTRHFLRRFLENDLISPDADRSQLLALVGATCFCSTVFVSVALSCFKYAAGFHTPGQAAVAALDDKFFYIGLSMLVSALVAVSQWDGLDIDARDAAILEPLPVPIATIRRAKLSAVAALGVAAALVLNLAPSVVFPVVVVIKQHVSLFAVLWLVATHAAITVAAAAFGYATVIAARAALLAVVGPRWFSRVSPLVQGILVIALGTALLLLPGASARVERRALAVSTALSPPAWFLGAYEVASGTVLVDGPRVRLHPRLEAADRVATARYRAHRSQFEALAGVAGAALLLVFATATVAYTWNARRLPQLAPITPLTSSRRSWLLRHVARVLVGRDATALAGFSFTLAVIWRSRTHRLMLASAAAVGLAMAFVALSGLDLEGIAASGHAVPRLLVVQPLLYGALLIGFRHAIRVPAELAASWGFQIGWRDETRRFLAGVRRAAVVSLVVPALAAALPVVAFVLGPQLAMAHAAIGLVGAIVLLEALLIGYDKVPFTCTYVPDENLKALGPIFAIAFLIGASVFGRLESAAVGTARSAATLIVALLALAAIARIVSMWKARAGPIAFDEVPERTQQLGLHG